MPVAQFREQCMCIKCHFSCTCKRCFVGWVWETQFFAIAERMVIKVSESFPTYLIGSIHNPQFSLSQEFEFEGDSSVDIAVMFSSS